MVSLETLHINELYRIAKELGIKYIKKYKKFDLIDKIKEAENKNQSIDEVFPFDKDLFIGPRKARVKKVKCECGDYINPAFKRQHISLSNKHRKETENGGWLKIKAAFKSRISTWRKLFKEARDIENTMNANLDSGTLVIKNDLDIYKNLKVNLEMECCFENKENEICHKFQLKNVEINEGSNLNEFWNNQKVIFITRCDEFEGKGSGYRFKIINFLQININKHTPLNGSSYIGLPKWIKDKKACINVKNKDNKCFMWTILSALHKVEKDPQRVSHYKKYENELNFDGIEFPVKISDIEKFEKLNKISILVVGINEKNGAAKAASP